MERKKGIPLVALIIFIALLVAIIITCVVILGINKFGKNDENKKELSDTTVQNATEEPEEDSGEEIDNEDIINEDEEIQSAYKLTGNGKTYAKYAIYASGGFSTENDNLGNDLKLQLAMAQVTNADLENGDSKSIDKAKIEEYAKNVFGEEEAQKIEYKDFSLYGDDKNFTDIYKTVGYVYNANNAKYEVKENDIKEEKNPTQITELVTKVIKYSNKIEIFVKPMIIKTFYSDEIKADGCEIIAGYDYQSKQFPENKSLKAVAYEAYEEILKSDYAKDLDGYKYNEMKNNLDLNRAQEYKYTIEKIDNKFQLKSFEMTEDITSPEQPEDLTNVELTDDEKKTINAELEAFLGDQATGAEAQALIDKIVEFNNKQTNPNNTITINLDGMQPTLADNDIRSLNVAINSAKEGIENEKKYNMKATYQTGMIKIVTITTNS